MKKIALSFCIILQCLIGICSLQSAAPSWVTHLKDNGFKAVIFDMDNTIINTQDLFQDAGCNVVTELLGRPLTGAEIAHVKKYLVFSAARIEAYLRTCYGLIKGIEEIGQQMCLVLEPLITEKLQYLEGFEAFIQQLKEHGFEVALATNAGMGFVFSVNDKLGLTKYFYTHLYACSAVKVLPKPDPAIFVFSAQKLGVAPAECLVIGDSEEDAQAAQAALMPSICIENVYNTGIRNLFSATTSNYAVIESALLQMRQKALPFGHYVPGTGIAEILQ